MHNISLRTAYILLGLLICAVFAGGCKNKGETVSLDVFIASSLSNAMGEIADIYKTSHPSIQINYNADSSGKLMQQILEGASCDLFFSADTYQMEQLEQSGMIIEETRKELLENNVVLISAKESGTKVTGFTNLELADSMAIASGSVPVGRYTRQLLVQMGKLSYSGNAAEITSGEIIKAFSGLQINECSNVSMVKEAVKERANEIGIVYESDAFSVREYVDIIDRAYADLTGEIIYPAALIADQEQSKEQRNAAEDYLTFLQSSEAQAVFEKYKFGVRR